MNKYKTNISNLVGFLYPLTLRMYAFGSVTADRFNLQSENLFVERIDEKKVEDDVREKKMTKMKSAEECAREKNEMFECSSRQQ